MPRASKTQGRVGRWVHSTVGGLCSSIAWTERATRPGDVSSVSRSSTSTNVLIDLAYGSTVVAHRTAGLVMMRRTP